MGSITVRRFLMLIALSLPFPMAWEPGVGPEIPRTVRKTMPWVEASLVPTMPGETIPDSRRRPGIFRDEDGRERRYRPGVVLAKRRGGEWERVSVPEGREGDAVSALRRDKNYTFAELDVFLTRQFTPSDSKVTNQWHHRIVNSTNAWAISLGGDGSKGPQVQVAIVDSPFQMNHPDLEPNSVAGWDLIKNRAILSETNGYYHSTITAGMAAAALNNGIGVSGMANSQLVPINIGDEPSTGTMADAIRWAANKGIRVVNVSWDGAFSAVINDAGGYLKEKARGMLFMAGVNGNRRLNYTAHPHIYAVSMTDETDQARSASGPHIDFAAPGWDIFSTTIHSTYEADSGTSYAAPVMAGIAAWVMAVNPNLGPDEIDAIFKNSCVDLGTPGWDERYGWGRVDFGSVAQKAFATTAISRVTAEGGGVAAVYESGTVYRLLRSADAVSWEVVTSPLIEIAGGKIILRDSAQFSLRAYYKVEITRPR